MNWHLFLAAFAFIFVAALPGRTTFVMIMMAAKSSPLGVFAGAALAFAAQVAISIFLGKLFALLPQVWIHLGAGILFLYFAVHFWKNSERIEETSAGEQKLHFFKAAKTAFLAVFVAEFGDVSQIAIASFYAERGEIFLVFGSALLALWLIAAMAVLLGSHAHRVLPSRHMQKIAAVIFLCIGVYSVFDGVKGLL